MVGQFSLSWDAYKQNICNGLSALQQNGEFVDMTLAADGHHVKVHRMVLSLVSPYIKELLASAQCPHPIIFLNKISYATLSAILEYAYTGEVHVSKENLSEVIEAGKELHIRGLEDMKVEVAPQQLISQAVFSNSKKGNRSGTAYLELEKPGHQNKTDRVNYETPYSEVSKSKEHYMETVFLNEDSAHEIAEIDDDVFDNAMDTDGVNTDVELERDKTNKDIANDASIQYTISQQGSLQIILNRYLYYLRYTSRKGNRQWRCLNYVNPSLCSRCPAGVVTKGDVVTKRFSAHNHPYHDKLILKKVRKNVVYSTICEAEVVSHSMQLKKPPKSTPHTKKKQ